jgi:hypothetical protein
MNSVPRKQKVLMYEKKQSKAHGGPRIPIKLKPIMHTLPTTTLPPKYTVLVSKTELMARAAEKRLLKQKQEQK